MQEHNGDNSGNNISESKIKSGERGNLQLNSFSMSAYIMYLKVYIPHWRMSFMTIRQMYYCTRGKTRCNDRVQVMGDFDCGRTDACLLVLRQDACEIGETLR